VTDIRRAMQRSQKYMRAPGMRIGGTIIGDGERVLVVC
jgi:hypothetical protein